MRVLSTGFSSSLYAFLNGYELVTKIIDADIVVNPKHVGYCNKLIILNTPIDPEVREELDRFNTILDENTDNYPTDKVKPFIQCNAPLTPLTLEDLRSIIIGSEMFIETPKFIESDDSALMKYLIKVFSKSSNL